jgi:hypothetical protein
MAFARSSLVLLLGLLLAGCAQSKWTRKYPVKLTPRLSAPPPNQALVNFHRPSKLGSGMTVPVFDGNGVMLCNLPGGSGFQWVGAPGEHVFISLTPIHADVIKAQLAPNRIYDIMIDFRFGQGDQIVPMPKHDPRRSRLAEFEGSEQVVTMVRDALNEEFERGCQAQLQEIRRDFLGGAKQSRLKLLDADDCR